MQAQMLMQKPEAIATSTAQQYTSCTPHSARARFHVRYSDFVEIADNDESNGDALRVAEILTNERIKAIRRQAKVPPNCLPHQDDLWIEMPLRLLESLTLRAHGKSSYARCLASSKSDTGMPRSLVELGFLRMRCIARPGPMKKDLSAATIYYDQAGEFILVDSLAGEYVGFDGEQKSAISQGWRVSRQYLYEIEAINAAIAALDWIDPPEEPDRWPSPVTVRVRRKGPASINETTTSNAGGRENGNNDVQRGASKPSPIVPFDYQNITSLSDVSTDNAVEISPSQVIRRPWSAVTIMELAAEVLGPTASSDIQAAHRLFKSTEGLAPLHAWERLDRVIRYMATPGSPSWWQRDEGDPRDWRKTKAPVTLRDVAKNFFIQWNDCDKNGWYPAAQTLYEPIYEDEEVYAAGYGGSVSPPPIEPMPSVDSQPDDAPAGTCEAPAEPATIIVDAPIVDVSPPPLPPSTATSAKPAMKATRAESLARQIGEKYPEIIVGILELDDGQACVGIQVGDDDWFDVASLREWLDPGPETRRAIEKALDYGGRL